MDAAPAASGEAAPGTAGDLSSATMLDYKNERNNERNNEQCEQEKTTDKDRNAERFDQRLLAVRLEPLLRQRRPYFLRMPVSVLLKLFVASLAAGVSTALSCEVGG